MKLKNGKIARRWAAGVLAFIIMLSPVVGQASFAGVLGETLHTKSLNIANETVLANGVYWNTNASDKITENYITYKPGSSVVPIIAYGNDVYGAASFATASNIAISERGSGTVLAGINGDYFTMANGVPQGIEIKDSVLYTSGTASYPSIGFYADGTAIIGSPSLNIKLSGDTLTSSIPSLHLNKIMTNACGVVLYTDEFGNDDTNKATIPTYNVLVQITDGQPKMNGVMTGTVYSAAAATGASAIPAGMMMISMSAATTYTWTLNQLKALKAGDSLTFDFTADAAWDNVVYAIGAGEKIVTASTNVAPMSTSMQKALNPRTAVGIKADGSLVLYTVDGRETGTSMGLTLTNLGARMIELGCVEAVNMDGGGSTAINSIYPGNTVSTTVNTPSEGSQRSCANYIMLVNTGDADGNISHLHPYPYDVMMLAGASTAFTVKATDSNYYPVSAPAANELTYSATNNVGTFNGNGVFTAGPATSFGVLNFQADNNVTGTATVNIITKPDSISLINQAGGSAATAVTVSGGNTVDLSINAVYKKSALIVSDSCFTWGVTGGIGTIDGNGLFTAAKVASGSGTITASIGGLTASVPVTISSTGQLIESFEGTTSAIPAASSAGITVKVNTNLEKVRYGYKSAAVTYDFEEAGENVISIPTTISFTTSPDSLSFWVYGDGSGNTLSAMVTTASGSTEAAATKLDYTGWKLVTVDIPNGTTALTAFRISNTGTNSGTFYIDQIMRASGYYLDNTPPLIQMTLTGQALTATVNDVMDTALSSANIKLTYDGTAVVFAYNSTTDKLTATIPASDGKSHKLTLTVSDRSGNVQRGSLAIAAAAGAVQPFADMGSHWAKDSTTYLYNQGIIKGTNTDQGMLYKPDAGITRSEFAVIMSRWVGADETKYQGTVLPFADAASIPSWALGSTKAMYAMGIIQGSGSNGKVYFKPGSTISREEVMTIIGRTQQRGYAEADLTSYNDNATISSWAVPYVKSLVKQGVVGGYDGGLWPKNAVTRAQIATMIFKLN